MKEQLSKEAVAQRVVAGMDADEAPKKFRRVSKKQRTRTSKHTIVAEIVTTGERRVDRVIDYLGGPGVIVHEIASAMDAHRVIAKGLPKQAVTHLLKNLTIFHEKDVLSGALGMSARTQQRLSKAEPDKALSVEVSSRTWQFAEVRRKPRRCGSRRLRSRSGTRSLSTFCRPSPATSW
jgi:uncharacterized protein (DUF2384 family)